VVKLTFYAFGVVISDHARPATVSDPQLGDS